MARLCSPLARIVAILLVASALAGCRFDVNPAELDVSANVGESVAETLEVTNTGDELVELTLAVSVGAATLSTDAATLQPGEAVDIEVTAECLTPAERHMEIAVTGRSGNKSATVRVPFVLNCVSQAGGAYLVALELFQGPPIYKKDYRTGEETEPVNLARPENGAAPVAEWQRVEPVDDGSGDTYYPSKDDAWSADNDGFVTAIWGRRAAVAVTAFHTDESLPPEFSASVDGTALPVLLQETEASGDGFETVTVFDIARERYQRGAVLDLSITSDEGSQSERLALFGETVEPVMVTWIPIDVPEFPAPTIDAEHYMEGVAAWLPIADYTTGVGPTMEYAENGSEGYGSRYDIWHAVNQLREHHVVNACGRDEIYVGYPDNHTMYNTENSSGSRGAASLGDRQVMVGSMIMYAEDYYDSPTRLDIHKAATLNGHELAHAFGQVHVPGCNMRGTTTVDYPYAEGKIGPGQIWSWITTELLGRDDQMTFFGSPRPPGIQDIMMACSGEWVVSDFAYQLMTLYRQWSETTTVCEAPSAASAVGGKVAMSTPVPKSSPVDPAPRSVAIAGQMSADGIASISMVTPTGNPAWAVSDKGAFTLEVIDAGGTVLHREPVPVAHDSHGHGHGESFWSARVPYFENAETVILRGPAGEVRLQAEIEPDQLEAGEMRVKR